MAEEHVNHQGSAVNATGTVTKVQTYQEVEYLKELLGPALISALSDLVLHRPLDPIEYLGHWLIRWRFNQELKAVDTANALEVAKLKKWAKYKDVLRGFTSPGFVPTELYPPIGYGGPIFGEGTEEIVDDDFGVEEIFDRMRSSDEESATEFVGEEGADGHIHFGKEYGSEDETGRPITFIPGHPIEDGGRSSGSLLTEAQVHQRRKTREEQGRNESVATKSQLPPHYRGGVERTGTPHDPRYSVVPEEINNSETALDKYWDTDNSPATTASQNGGKKHSVPTTAEDSMAAADEAEFTDDDG